MTSFDQGEEAAWTRALRMPMGSGKPGRNRSGCRKEYARATNKRERMLRVGSRASRRKPRDLQPIVKRSSTDATPVADQAAFSTARRSSQLSTLPSRITLLPFCTVTWIAFASSSV